MHQRKLAAFQVAQTAMNELSRFAGRAAGQRVLLDEQGAMSGRRRRICSTVGASSDIRLEKSGGTMRPKKSAMFGTPRMMLVRLR